MYVCWKFVIRNVNKKRLIVKYINFRIMEFVI